MGPEEESLYRLRDLEMSSPGAVGNVRKSCAYSYMELEYISERSGVNKTF